MRTIEELGGRAGGGGWLVEELDEAAELGLGCCRLVGGGRLGGAELGGLLGWLESDGRPVPAGGGR